MVNKQSKLNVYFIIDMINNHKVTASIIDFHNVIDIARKL